MRKWLIALVAIGSIFACTSSTTTEALVWKSACEFSPYSCKDILPPIVVYEDMGGDGDYGYYDGSKSIYINYTLPKDHQVAAMIHETVHYLQVQNGTLTIPTTWPLMCAAEDEAFKVTNWWATDQGLTDLVREDWWKVYVNCWPYYADES